METTRTRYTGQFYGMALFQWGERIVRELELRMNSLRWQVRMQFHCIGGTSDPAIDPGQLKVDLELLRN